MPVFRFSQRCRWLRRRAAGCLVCDVSRQPAALFWEAKLKNTKVHHRTGHEGREVEWRYSSTLSLTLALDGVSGERHAPDALPTVPIVKEAGRAPGLFWWGTENLAPEIRSPTVKSVASRYTDWATPAPKLKNTSMYTDAAVHILARWEYLYSQFGKMQRINVKSKWAGERPSQDSNTNIKYPTLG
jgi:hypothetical protein